ncbi:hypothetical protein NE237_011556 [Protea cynaroides]|uniref:Uncharacterized protein n=1 Tax=Protea cynaroides TaxID=273540 RepID=A0A9Q0GY53_9MAGN|nr:hypothetical protein NE237_011556 [Protea cynaroides]
MISTETRLSSSVRVADPRVLKSLMVVCLVGRLPPLSGGIMRCSRVTGGDMETTAVGCIIFKTLNEPRVSAETGFSSGRSLLRPAGRLSPLSGVNTMRGSQVSGGGRVPPILPSNRAGFNPGSVFRSQCLPGSVMMSSMVIERDGQLQVLPAGDVATPVVSN